jgi:hypothetical protein
VITLRSDPTNALHANGVQSQRPGLREERALPWVTDAILLSTPTELRRAERSRRWPNPVGIRRKRVARGVGLEHDSGMFRRCDQKSPFITAINAPGLIEVPRRIQRNGAIELGCGATKSGPASASFAGCACRYSPRGVRSTKTRCSRTRRAICPPNVVRTLKRPEGRGPKWGVTRSGATILSGLIRVLSEGDCLAPTQDH